jgi:hypothetical protein
MTRIQETDESLTSLIWMLRKMAQILIEKTDQLPDSKENDIFFRQNYRKRIKLQLVIFWKILRANTQVQFSGTFLDFFNLLHFPDLNTKSWNQPATKANDVPNLLSQNSG